MPGADQPKTARLEPNVLRRMSHCGSDRRPRNVPPKHSHTTRRRNTMRRFTIIAGLATALAMLTAAVAIAAVNWTISLKPGASYPRATGSSQFQSQGSQRELQVEVEHLKALAGKQVNIFVNGTKWASPTVSSLGIAQGVSRSVPAAGPRRSPRAENAPRARAGRRGRGCERSSSRDAAPRPSGRSSNPARAAEAPRTAAG